MHEQHSRTTPPQPTQSEQSELATIRVHRAICIVGSDRLRSAGSAGEAHTSRPIEQLIEKRFGLAVNTILRGHDEMTRIVAKNPLGDVATDGSKYVVAFMAEPPQTPVGAVLDGADIGDDRYIVDGTEMYVWCPGGLRDSPLMTILGKAKSGPSTTCATGTRWRSCSR
ncbi:DUF1697 domain-containing protein [Plantactinospora solaniradicis]|uniref:DUF1697 domain-containing protein n=1 Tax=Plantactinospora solaniradicis TaxID=1723736 RepID=A0ABW1KIR0_9ACTN